MAKLRHLAPDATAPGDSEKAQALATRIAHNVITVLGRTDDFTRIKVVRLWENTIRVNVFTGNDPASSVITDSFFVLVDDDGNILNSTPPLARRYQLLEQAR